MTLPLSTDMISAAYEFLKTTPPFNKWHMQDCEDVKFNVSRKLKKKFAQYQWDGERHTVTLSAHGVGYTHTLMGVLAHEMIHMHLEEAGMESRGNENVHNAAFRKFAAIVCKHHGFDPKAFY